jgi:hypothetical protein
LIIYGNDYNSLSYPAFRKERIMTTLLVTFGIIVFLVLIMAIGVLFGRKPIAGSCGGYEALHIACAAGCAHPCEKRLAAQAKARAEQEAAQENRAGEAQNLQGQSNSISSQ